MAAKLIYCATPSRLTYKMHEIMDMVKREGNAPLHPFQALPYDAFEGNLRVGREKAMEFCLRLVDICDTFYLCGVSEGTLGELVYAQKAVKPVVLHPEFDSDWKKFYKQLGEKYGNPLD